MCVRCVRCVLMVIHVSPLILYFHVGVHWPFEIVCGAWKWCMDVNNLTLQMDVQCHMYRMWSSCDYACPPFRLFLTLEPWHEWCWTGDKPQICKAFSWGLNANKTIWGCPNTEHCLDLHHIFSVMIYNMIQSRCFALTNFLFFSGGME